MSMQASLQNCLAPAKLNLFLHVVGRRSDGYHLLQTVFQLLDHGDRLDFEVRSDSQVRRCSDIPGVPEQQDLIVRAALLLQTMAIQRKPDFTLGADISIRKILPMGGGLGGGSSDAATTLMALNHLWQVGLTRTELMQLGLQLGADVPFFIFGENAFAEGIGEALAPISTPEKWFVVLEPGVSVPTPQIFSSEHLTRDTKPVRITDFPGAHNNFGKNDLQTVAVQLYPEVAEAIKCLSEFGNETARMTGSGACVFCALDSEQEADQVLEALPKRWKAWKAKSLQRHPLTDLLQS